MTPEAWIPYCGPAPAPGEILSRWNADPILIIALAVAALWQWRRAAQGPAGGQGAPIGALALLALLFVSPFCALTSALFSARAVHHLLLVIAVAPLLAASWLVSRRKIPGGLAAATAGQAVIFWLWHAPPAYAAALSSDAVYWLMQASILAAAAAFWRAVRVASAPAGAVALLVTMVHMGLLGALITFAPAPLYAPHLGTTASWGLSPLEDQQLAGLIMWVPAAGFYLGAALILVARALGSSRPQAVVE